MKVREAIAQAFVAEGTQVVFALMGDGNMLWTSSIGQLPGVDIVHARHENAAIGMADGYARVTGKVGVASITCGPGVTQTPTALVGATRSGTPMVAFAGDTPMSAPFHLQEFDEEGFLAAAGIAVVRITAADQVAARVQLAFARARTERRPVVLLVPYELQELDDPWGADYRPSDELMVTQQRIAPDSTVVAQAAELLARAERPVILAGRGAVHADARAAIEELADRVGALVGTTLLAKGWFDDRPWDIGVCGAFSSGVTRRLLAEADCILGVGARLGFYTTEAGYMFPDAKIIRVDVEPRGYLDGMRVADLHVQGDAVVAVEEITKQLEASAHTGAGWRTDTTRALLAESSADTVPFPLEPGTVDPRGAIDEMQAAIPRDWLISTGVGHYWQFVVNGFHGRHPDRYVTPIDFAAIGNGIAIGIGAAVGSDRPTVLIEGDGSLLMYVEELECLARHQIPLLVFVVNDGAYGAEVHKMRAKGFHTDEAIFGHTDLAAVAAAFGLDSVRVDEPGQIAGIVERFARDPHPMVVDVHVSTTVMAVQYRRLHFGEDV